MRRLAGDVQFIKTFHPVDDVGDAPGGGEDANDEEAQIVEIVVERAAS